jgi:hypothetical protein
VAGPRWRNDLKRKSPGWPRNVLAAFLITAFQLFPLSAGWAEPPIGSTESRALPANKSRVLSPDPNRLNDRGDSATNNRSSLSLLAEAVEWKYFMNSGLRKICNDKSLVFLFGATPLRLDVRLITGLRAIDWRDLGSGICPAEPVRTWYISIRYPADPEAKRILDEHGLPHWIDISNAHLTAGATRFPTAPETRRTLPNGSAIEDITNLFEGTRGSRDRSIRAYLIVHPPQRNEIQPRAVVISCVGLLDRTPARGCTAHRYRVGPDLIIEYLFRPAGVHVPHSVWPSLPVREPDDFPALDLRVRAWISDIIVRRRAP